MSDTTEENNTVKPRGKDGRLSMWYYYALLSGSLLMVGGVVGVRYFRLPRFSPWSLLCSTSSITGMYLTISSIHRLYNSIRDSVSEEAGNEDSSSETPTSLENVDKNIRKNPFQATFCAESNISEENVIKYVIGNNAEEKPELLSSVVTDLDASSSENNDTIGDLSDLRSVSDNIVIKCENDEHILTEKITVDCIITQTLVAGDNKDAQVVANDARKVEVNKDVENEEVKGNINIDDPLAKYDACKLPKEVRRNVSNEDEIIKGFKVEEVTAKNVICENSVEKDIVSESNPIENIDASESIEENVKVADIEEPIPRDNSIQLSVVVVDYVTESELDNEVAASEFLKDFNTTEADIEEVTPRDIGIEEVIPQDIGIEEVMTMDIGIEEDMPKDIGIEEDMPKDIGIEEVMPKDIGIEEVIPQDIGIEEDMPKDIAIEEVIPENIGIEEIISENIGMEEVMPKNIGMEEVMPKNIGIEEVTPKDIGIAEVIHDEDHVTDNVTNEKLDNNQMANEFIEEDIKEIKMENILDMDMTIKNPVANVNVTESEWDKNDITLERETKVEESTGKHDIINDPLAVDCKLFKKHRIHEYNEDVLIVEDEIKEMAEKDIFQNTVDNENESNSTINVDANESIEKDIKVFEIEETITKGVNVEFPVTESSITEINVNVMENEFLIEYNTKPADIEKSVKKDIGIEENLASDNVIEEKFNEDIMLIEIVEEDSITKDETQKEVITKNPVAEADVTESKLDKDAAITLEDDMVKGGKIGEIEVILETIEDLLTKTDGNKQTLNKETLEVDTSNADKMESMTAKNIFENPGADNIVHDNSIEKIYQDESNKRDIKEIKIEEVTSLQASIGNLLIEEDNTQRKSGNEIHTNEYLEECDIKEAEIEVIPKDIRSFSLQTSDQTLIEEDNTQRKSGKEIHTNEYLEERDIKEAEIEVIPKDISIETHATEDVTDDRFNKDDLESEIFHENVIKESINKDVEMKDLDENEICKFRSAKNIVGNESLEEGKTLKEAEIEEVTAMYISFEDTMVRYKVEDTSYKDEPEESNFAKEIFNQNVVVEDDINKNSDDNEITSFEINMSYIPVDTRMPTKDPERQIEAEAIVDEQNVTRPKEICTQKEQSLKPLESTVATPTKQLVCTSTVEVGFLSPNTATDIGVFFRKSARTRLAAQFPNPSIEPAKDFSYSECSLSKQSANTSVSNSPTSTNTVIRTSNRQSFENVLNPNYQSASLEDSTSDADIVIGYSSRDSGSVVSLDQQITKTERGVLVLSSLPDDVRQDILLSFQSPGLSDSALVSSSDEPLGLFDTATNSATESSPVVSLSIQFPSDNTAVLPTGQFPISNFSSPSGNSSRQSSKIPDRSVASLAGHYPRSPTNDASSRVRHSPTDVDNRFRRRSRPTIGGVGHIRRASWSSAASHPRLSVGRGIATPSVSSAGVSEEDVFSRAADSQWVSCDDISQARHSIQSLAIDVFSLARSSPWSSCGDVSSRARRFRTTRDCDVFSQAHYSPWVSGSGTIFHGGQLRNPTGGRPFSNSRHYRRASVGSSVPRARHSSSSSADVTLPPRFQGRFD